MLQQIDKTRDDEVVLLARVYALILSWNESDAQAETRVDEKTNAPAPTDAARRKGAKNVDAH